MALGGEVSGQDIKESCDIYLNKYKGKKEFIALQIGVYARLQAAD